MGGSKEVSRTTVLIVVTFIWWKRVRMTLVEKISNDVGGILFSVALYKGVVVILPCLIVFSISCFCNVHQTLTNILRSRNVIREDLLHMFYFNLM
jgi:hypothetical protein